MDFTEQFDQLRKLLSRSKSVLVASHGNPEGDALGSSIALGLGLEELGKEVMIYNVDPIPQILRFLPGTDRVTSTLPARPVDLFFAVDMGDFNMVGEPVIKMRPYSTLVNIDHHITNTRFGDLNIVDGKASSTGQVVNSVLKALGCKVTREIAANIYCTLITDTGSFRYSNTTSECLHLAAEMIEIGVNAKDVADYLFETYPKKKLDLLQRVLSSIEVECGGKYSHITMLQRDLREFNIEQEWSEGFINYPRGIEGVEVSVFFKESAENQFKMSMRSKGRVSVAEICKEFGGGGHYAAAGCRLNGSLESVKKQISSAVRRALSKL
ncbi:MAG: bifunctional oligoribonuclease/PAP phosphatase NrnA [Deltaproteobacteria bacterium]|nr:bifunctional oligoribonuclease/PAP phosphatase NrnA [Deltaproteobacteria bacterium]